MFLHRNIRWLVVSLALLAMASYFATEASAKQHKQNHKNTPKYLHSPKCQNNHGGLIGATNAEKAFHYFLGKGFTPIQSAGLVGNLMQETAGINPRRVNYLGAVGIGQWLYGRKTGLYNFAGSHKENAYYLKTQLQYIWYEFRHTQTKAYRELRSEKTLTGAALSVRVWYERPGLAEANDANRLSYAQSVLNNAKEVHFCGLWKQAQPSTQPKHVAKDQTKKHQSFGLTIHLSPKQREMLINLLKPVLFVLFCLVFFYWLFPNRKPKRQKA